jgi:uncharacterized membrane protein YtjA (UPF0391 family)
MRTTGCAAQVLNYRVALLARSVLIRTTADKRPSQQQEIHMLYYALVFLVIALIAGALGFFGIAGAATSIAQILFFLFLVLFVLSLIFGRVRKPPL